MTLFEHAHLRLTRAARANPCANNAAAVKRLRAFVTQMLRSEING